MLGKLIKYEFKATYKFMLLIYGLLIAMSVLFSVNNTFDIVESLEGITEKFQAASAILNVFVVIMISLFVIITLVVFSGMFFYAIKRFKDNLLGDEGYLMHTLPVKTRDNIIAKCVVSVIWTIVSFFVVVFAYYILIFGSIGIKGIIGIAAIIFDEFESGADVAKLLLFLVELVIFSIVSISSSYLHIYASMAAGFSANTHRVAKSIGIYVLISIATSIFKSMTTSFLPILYVGEVDTMTVLHITLWVTTATEAVCAVALYFITHHFMDKKLNLQ